MRSFTCGDGDAEKNSGGQRCESDLGKGIKDKFCCSGLADWVSLFVLFSLKKKKGTKPSFWLQLFDMA